MRVISSTRRRPVSRVNMGPDLRRDDDAGDIASFSFMSRLRWDAWNPYHERSRDPSRAYRPRIGGGTGEKTLSALLGGEGGSRAAAREGEVGAGNRSAIPHLTPSLSAPGGGEGDPRGGTGEKALSALLGEREGPAPQRGRVRWALATAPQSPTSPHPSPPPGAEREIRAAGPAKKPSPPFWGEREGPAPQRGRVRWALATAPESPTSPHPSPPPGAEREIRPARRPGSARNVQCLSALAVDGKKCRNRMLNCRLGSESWR